MRPPVAIIVFIVQTLDERTRHVLASYAREVRSLPNEAAKTHRFAALIAELFPGTKASVQFAAGVEKLIRIETSKGSKRGFIDSYHNNAVIEFERSLKATGTEAVEQLRGYVAGVWAEQKKPGRPLLAIASDGITWRLYRPGLLRKGVPTPDDVSLDLLRELTISDSTLSEFWLWLTSLLFRPTQVPATADQFRQDFGARSPAFADAMAAMTEAWALVQTSPESQLALATWQRYLTVTYGSLSTNPDIDRLFLKHTYLASVARLLVWASFSGGKTSEPLRTVAGDVLSGAFFEAHQLANMVDDDFFQWVRRRQAEAVLAPVWERILAEMLTYDLSALREDVLKGVYQELVDPADRHDLGEYYTPDWLCERITEELLPARGFVPVLDPTCGSGSFLRAAIDHFRRSSAEMTDAERLHSTLQHVVGIDIHPLAVTISRATYVLALGELIRAAKRPVNVPVYLADSLFLPAEVKQQEITSDGGFGYRVTFGGREVIVPESLIEVPEIFDDAVAACAKIAAEHADGQRETRDSLGAYLTKAVPKLAQVKSHERILDALWVFTRELAGLIRHRKNSIWAFIVRNAYRPAMLRGRFKVVIGNPPWLSYRYISDPEYQKEVKQRAVDEYAVAPPSQQLVTQMELAIVFLAHSLTVLAEEGAQLAFVMPRSVLNADQHGNLRTRSYRAPIRLVGYWDLKDVHPLFNVPSCVLFAVRDSVRKGKASDTLPVLEWEGQLPGRDLPWLSAKDHLSSQARSGNLIFLGQRTALSTEPGRTEPNAASPYAAVFRDGATIYPRSFYFVKLKEPLQSSAELDRLYWMETDPDQAEGSQPPYDDVYLKGNADGRFLFSTALSRHVLPFVTLPPAIVLLPVARRDGVLTLLTATDLKRAGYLETSRWFSRVEQIWKSKRGSKAGQDTVYAWLDYQGKLSGQHLSQRHLVLYNATGTNVSAAYLDRNSLPVPFVVDHKLYWTACESVEEADYLVAILNADAVNQAIKPFQSLGLLGERDIHKKVLDLPFPAYSSSIEEHRVLARLGAEARRQAALLLQTPDFPSALARRRSLVRTGVGTLLEEIDQVVRKLI